MTESNGGQSVAGIGKDIKAPRRGKCESWSMRNATAPQKEKTKAKTCENVL